MKRIFVVGCSRSGTTIFQKLFSSHFNLFTAPETGFFLPGGFHLFLRFQNLCYPKYTSNSLQQINNNDFTQEFTSFSFSRNSNSFQKFFDDKAKIHSLQGWVEKTPLHLLRINLIKKYIEDPHFIIVLREPVAILNSLLKRSDRHPKFSYQDEYHSIDLINTCLLHSLKYINCRDCTFISFESFKKDPEGIFSMLQSRLDLKKSENSVKVSFDIIRMSEDWKKDHLADKIAYTPETYDKIIMQSFCYALNTINYTAYMKILTKAY